MQLPFVLIMLFGLNGMISGKDCVTQEKVNAVVGPILDKRKGLHVTLSPDDLANLVELKHGILYLSNIYTFSIKYKHKDNINIHITLYVISAT